MITYAIGDIHGCLDKLHELVQHCHADAAGRPSKFVFLGDYIDRGPDSRGVIQFLIELQRERAEQDIFLKGNHEDLLLTAADSDLFEDRWLDNGGIQTLESYGVYSAQDIPGDHLQWLRQLRLFYDDGQRFFVHAGVDPDRPLDQQQEHDLLWIREPFLSSQKDFGRLVVHGHTPLREGVPDLRANRLNLDTGAVFGGPLTAAVFVSGASGAKDFLAI